MQSSGNDEGGNKKEAGEEQAANDKPRHNQPALRKGNGAPSSRTNAIQIHTGKKKARARNRPHNGSKETERRTWKMAAVRMPSLSRLRIDGEHNEASVGNSTTSGETAEAGRADGAKPTGNSHPEIRRTQVATEKSGERRS